MCMKMVKWPSHQWLGPGKYSIKHVLCPISIFYSMWSFMTWPWPEITITKSLSHSHYQYVKYRVCNLQITFSYEMVSAAAWVNTCSFHIWPDPDLTFDLFKNNFKCASDVPRWDLLIAPGVTLWQSVIEIVWGPYGAGPPPLLKVCWDTYPVGCVVKCYWYDISCKTRSRSRLGAQSQSRTSATTTLQPCSKSWSNNSQGACEWIDAELGALWVESEQILHLKVRLTLPQNWEIWVGNDTLWMLFFHSFPPSSLQIFHSHPLKI